MSTQGPRRASFAAGLVVGLLCAGLVAALAASDPAVVETVAAPGGAGTADAWTDPVTGDPADGPTGRAIDGDARATGGVSQGGGGQAAPGQSSPSDGAGQERGPQTTAGGAASGGATDRGVTADSVNIVVLLADTGGAAAFGLDGDIGENRAAFQGYIDEVNEAGGIHGRTIVPTYITFDPVNYDNLQTACTRATEDVESFAVVDLGLYYGPAILCISEQHDTPFVTYEGEPDDYYTRANGRFLSLGISKSRMMRIFPLELERQGLLRDHTIGVLGTSFPTDKSAVIDHLLPTLDRLGYRYTYYEVSEDITTAQAQMPVAVQTMQQAGVDRMLLTGNLLVNQPFVQQAERRFFRPQYLVADFACGTCDAATTLMPQSYDGTIGITTLRTGSERLGLPQPPYEAECARRYNEQTGKTAEYRYPNDPNYTAVLVCTIMDRLFDGMRRAGPGLTRDSWARAMQQTGEFDAGGLLAASWGPGKLDAPDAIRTMKWHYEHQGEVCRCFLPVDEPRPAPE